MSRAQKRFLIKEGFVLCRDAPKHTYLMRKIGMTNHEIENTLADMHELCTSKNYVLEPCMGQ